MAECNISDCDKNGVADFKGSHFCMEHLESAMTDNHWDNFDKLTKDMDLPEGRRRDVRWLLRNISIRNDDHPNITDACYLLKVLGAK